MGNAKSSEPPDSVPVPVSSTDRCYGMVNFGNTCYLNSVFQALCHCRPFRDQILEYYYKRKPQHSHDDSDDDDDDDDDDSVDKNASDRSLVFLLGELFDFVENNPEQHGTLEPQHFVERIQQRNATFAGTQHQDAHEFLHFLLNDLSDSINEEHPDKSKDIMSPPNFIENLFEGVLTNRMQCLRCDSISSRDEKFMDLSIDISDHSSLSHCLRQFGRRELLAGDCKFRCSHCLSLQEAHKWMQVKRQPRVLICHLKRFKYTESMEFKKLCYRVCFSQQLRLQNLVEDLEPCLYELFAVVVHVGSGSSHGHYVSVIRQHTAWYLYDDNIIHHLEYDCLHHFFGSVHDPDHNDGYMLFYQQTP